MSEMKKVLVTGATGFVGKYLTDLLAEKNLEVHGTSLEEGASNRKKIITKLYLKDENQVSKLISTLKPDMIFHLAALTSPKDSFKNPKETFINNIGAEINILEALKNQKLKSRIIIISSAEIYGMVDPSDLPIDEDTPLNPTNPYAVSKLAQDFLALQYHLAHKLDVVRLRPFNHTGPGQSPNFVIPAFAKKIAEIEKGKLDKLTVGNLEGKRDFTDVRDMAKAYEMASEMGRTGEVYNIGSGMSYKIGEILDKLLSLSTVKIKVEQDPTLFMPLDNPELVCDFSKFASGTGWKPQIPIDQTLRETLDYWRSIT